jgi:hypothetical protein
MTAERPPQDADGRSGRRRHRRVVAPATDGVPESERADDTVTLDAGPTDDTTSEDTTAQVTERGARSHPQDERAHGERWWQEQRPPHWE